jgi:hypothetical protein
MTGVVIRIMGPMLLMKDSAGTHISFFFSSSSHYRLLIDEIVL